MSIFTKVFPAGDTAVQHPEVQWCLELMNQIEALLEDSPENARDPEVRRPVQLLCCLLRDLESGEINYDATEGIVFSRSSLLSQVREARGRLVQLRGEESLARPLYVRQMAAGARNSVVAESSLRRELLFIVSQAASLPRVVRLKRVCA